MTKIWNLTPHTINIYSGRDVTAQVIAGRATGKYIANSGAEPERIFPSDGVLRCAVDREEMPFLDGIPVFKNTYGPFQGVPPLTTGDAIIVSAICGLSPEATELKNKGIWVLGPGAQVVGTDGKTILGCVGLCEF